MRAVKQDQAIQDLESYIHNESGAVTIEMPLSYSIETGDEDLDPYDLAITPIAIGTKRGLSESGLDGTGTIIAMTGTIEGERKPITAAGIIFSSSGSESNSLTATAFGFENDDSINQETTPKYEPQPTELGRKEVNQNALPSIKSQTPSISKAVSREKLDVDQEVINSYRDFNGRRVTVADASDGFWDLVCSFCPSALSAICGGANQLGFWGCLSRCVPLASSFPYLSGACAVFCEQVTTVGGVTVCVSSSGVVCDLAFDC